MASVRNSDASGEIGRIEAAVPQPATATPLPGPRKLPLAAVELTGRRLTIHRAAMALLGVACAAAIITHFLPQHRVVGGVNLIGTLCLAPDCAPEPASYTLDGPTCTGFDHSGILPPLVLLGILLLAVRSFARPSLAAGMATAAITCAGWIVAFDAIFNLDHMFDTVTTLWPETVFAVSFIGIFFHGAANLVLQLVLYVGQRRKDVSPRPALARRAPR